MPCALRRLEDGADRGLARRQIGREAPFVPHRRRQALLREHALQRVVGLGPDPERLGERRGAGGHDHELLQVDGVRRVDAAVDHVHHRHRQRRRVVAAEVPVQRHAVMRGRGLRGRKRDAEERVCPQAALVRRPVEVDEAPVERFLVRRVEPTHGVGDLAFDVRDCARHALAAVGVAAVAELDRLELPGRGAGGHGGAAGGARLEPDVDLHGRVAARVEDLPRVDACDRAHSASLAWSK